MININILEINLDSEFSFITLGLIINKCKEIDVFLTATYAFLMFTNFLLILTLIFYSQNVIFWECVFLDIYSMTFIICKTFVIKYYMLYKFHRYIDEQNLIINKPRHKFPMYMYFTFFLIAGLQVFYLVMFDFRSIIMSVFSLFYCMIFIISLYKSVNDYFKDLIISNP